MKSRIRLMRFSLNAFQVLDKISSATFNLITLLFSDVRVGDRSYFNSALVNLYRSGSDYVRWHADNEPCFGKNPIIASVSFGATRKFQLKPVKITSGGESWTAKKINTENKNLIE